MSRTPFAPPAEVAVTRDPWAVKLGERLTAARRACGYNQTQAAHAVGIARNYLSKIEQGQTTVAAWIVFALARYYMCPVGEMFGDPARDAECPLAALHNLTAWQRHAVLELVRSFRPAPVD